MSALDQTAAHVSQVVTKASLVFYQRLVKHPKIIRSSGIENRKCFCYLEKTKRRLVTWCQHGNCASLQPAWSPNFGHRLLVSCCPLGSADCCTLARYHNLTGTQHLWQVLISFTADEEILFLDMWREPFPGMFHFYISNRHERRIFQRKMWQANPQRAAFPAQWAPWAWQFELFGNVGR